MRTNLRYFSLIIIYLIVYLFLIGGTTTNATTNKLKPKKFGLDLQLKSLRSNVPIQVLVPTNAETNYPVESSNRRERSVNEYVDLNDLYKNAKELIEQVLAKHKVPLSPNSEKYLKFTISKVHAESDWLYRVYLEFDMETGNGYKRHFRVQDQSSTSIERALGGTTSRAVERIFQNEKIIAYIEEPTPTAPVRAVAPQKVDSTQGLVTQEPKLQPLPISEPKQSKPKQSTKQPMIVKECGTPIWNIGDSWKFGNGETKIIRAEGDLYIAQDSSSSDLVAYDKNTLEKTFTIDDKGSRVKIESALPIYFDFPLYVGKTWKRHFSARTSFSNRRYDFLMEYKVLRIEDITVSAGTFKAFKIEINHMNDETKSSGRAHIWYCPEVKLFVKVALDGSSYWRFSQGCELMSFNLKDKETPPREIKLPLEKVDIPPQVQPTRVEKQQIAPPIAPSLSSQKQGVDIPPKSQLPVTEKLKAPASTPPPPSTDFVVVTGTSANIRSGAGNEFPIVTTVNQGAKLTLLGEYGKWFNVRLENGKEGWINSRFVQE